MNSYAMIRLARLEDAQALAILMKQLGYPTSSLEMRERLARLLRHPDYQTWVAEVDGKVVGMAGACLGYFYEKNGVYGRLLALAVDVQMQHQGIGTSLDESVLIEVVILDFSASDKSRVLARLVRWEFTDIVP
jgi:N-acetylglutamate synthase-like GNAT family acetyltransferase